MGRPRADRRRRDRPPEEEILFVAARLFAARGFTATSTRAIAAAAGLRQPSLFHWFPSKEAILERLLELSLEPSLAYAERVAAESGRPAPRLYRILRFDTRHLCTYPYDPAAILLSPEARGRRFRRFWSERERFISLLRALIEEGRRAGEFATVNAEVAAQALNGMNEAALSWQRRLGGTDPEQVSRELAGLALRALLADSREADAIVREVEA